MVARREGARKGRRARIEVYKALGGRLKTLSRKEGIPLAKLIVGRVGGDPFMGYDGLFLPG